MKTIEISLEDHRSLAEFNYLGCHPKISILDNRVHVQIEDVNKVIGTLESIIERQGGSDGNLARKFLALIKTKPDTVFAIHKKQMPDLFLTLARDCESLDQMLNVISDLAERSLAAAETFNDENLIENVNEFSSRILESIETFINRVKKDLNDQRVTTKSAAAIWDWYHGNTNFSAEIVRLFRKADPTNSRKLQMAFPEIYNALRVFDSDPHPDDFFERYKLYGRE